MSAIIPEILPPSTRPPPPACPPVQYSGTTGNILSPGFPRNYQNNLNCEYQITVSDPNLVVMVGGGHGYN